LEVERLARSDPSNPFSGDLPSKEETRRCEACPFSATPGSNPESLIPNHNDTNRVHERESSCATKKALGVSALLCCGGSIA